MLDARQECIARMAKREDHSSTAELGSGYVRLQDCEETYGARGAINPASLLSSSRLSFRVQDTLSDTDHTLARVGLSNHFHLLKKM